MRLYCTAPDPRDRPVTGEALADAARWADRAGLDGMLIEAGPDELEPWSAAQYVVERTRNLSPLVTVQPPAMHPYMVARMVSAIASVHGRRVDLHLVAGGTPAELRAFGCALGPDERAERLVEYTRIVTALLRAEDAVTFESRHHRVVDAVIYPSLPPRLAPRIFVGGPAAESARIAGHLPAGQLLDLPDPESLEACPPRPRSVVRAGIIARDTGDEARRVAGERERRGPWLVGSHAEVAAALVPYRRAGVAAIVLTGPLTEDDLTHAVTATAPTGADSAPVAPVR